MKKHLVLCILCTLCCVAYAQKIKIKTGIEVLKEQNFKCLEGKRVRNMAYAVMYMPVIT